MTITKKLADILGDVDRPGDYFASGRAELLAPSIEVEGVGAIALPLLPAQAKQLIKAASRAPYGRGTETVVDTKVRRTWQIEAGHVAIGGKHWPKTLAQIVARAAEGLGVTGPVTAELYKLLVYDKGSFFVSHRDTEKSSGMFATLVIALPSQSQGGDLVVRHKEHEAKLDLSCSDPAEIAFAAFYADCVHEVLPVTAGCRATLVFNLVRKGKGIAPVPPGYEVEIERTKALLESWAAELSKPDHEIAADPSEPEHIPEKIVVPLEHAYTPAELAFDKLKGTDAAVAKVLSVAAPGASCDLHLALLKVWESGSAEYNGRENWHYRRGRRDSGVEEDADDFEVIEVHDSSKSLSEWRRLNNDALSLGEMPFEDEELSPPDALDGLDPDEEHFREATGNEGASFDRTYARAALVVWPSARILAIVNQVGPKGTLPYLEDLIDRWQAAGPKKGIGFKQQALELAQLMRSTWPKRSWFERDSKEPTETGQMFRLLTRLGEPRLVEGMLDRLAEDSAHASADNAAIIGALDLLEDDAAADKLAGLVKTHGNDALGAAAALLREALKGPFSKNPQRLRPSAEELIAILPGDPEKAPKDQWGRSRESSPDAASLVDVVWLVDRIDGALAEQAAAHVLAWPKWFGLDAILVPAMKLLLQSQRRGKAEVGPAFKTLHKACVTHLERRIAEPLEAPRDWTRPHRVRCSCEHCAALSRFLADPTEERWTLRAAQQIRTHVEDVIRHAPADVDCETVRRGSPHSLVCTKNQASYRRRVAQRKQDLADIASLGR
jgi:predicted 2-oxoglutarate/Fe(II)-dependent dioxygenase YbiX